MDNSENNSSKVGSAARAASRLSGSLPRITPTAQSASGQFNPPAASSSASIHRIPSVRPRARQNTASGTYSGSYAGSNATGQNAALQEQIAKSNLPRANSAPIKSDNPQNSSQKINAAPQDASNAKTIMFTQSPEQILEKNAELAELEKKLAMNNEEISADPELEAPPAAALPVGMKIDGRYEILGTLGVGGFATVYRAHHIALDTEVALKVMDIKKGVDPSYTERFFREAKIAAKIRHSNVVGVYDFGHVEATGQPYIAMEMLHGRDLSHELSEIGPLSPKRMFVLFRPVLDALSVGHKLGIVHKDLKPENLYLVDPGGQRELMKILDFGVARVNSSEVAKLTTAGQLLGTPRYLAPEYIKTQSVTPAIDVYQMALIISEALTGIPAVTGDPFHAMMLHCSGQIQIAGFLLEGRVGEVFKKAIAIDPNERYADCEAFGKALDSVAEFFQSDTPISGGAPQLTPTASISGELLSMPLSKGASTGAIPMDSARISQEIAESKKKNKKVLIIMLAIVLMLICGVLYFVKRAQDEAKKSALTNEQLAKEKKDMEEKARSIAEASNKKIKFSFTTDPPGAVVQIKEKDDFNLCDATPCEYTFKASDLPVYVVVKQDGFKTTERRLDESSDSAIQINLEKLILELVFTLKYTPSNAAVKVGSTEVCSLSPCIYKFKLEDKAVTLTFTSPGYKPQNIILNEEEYRKSADVSVVLERNKLPTKTGTKSNPNTPSGQAQPAAPQTPKKEEKAKPSIMLL